MAVSYKKLWKLLIDRDMGKKDLRYVANIYNSSIAKIGRNENINTEVLVKICIALKSVWEQSHAGSNPALSAIKASKL